MQRVFIGVAVVIAATFGITRIAHHDAQKQSLPPHPAPPVAEVAIGPLPPAVSGADPEATQGLVVANFIKERERAEWIAAEERRLADEAERQRLADEAEAARAAALRPTVARPAAVPSGAVWPSSLYPCGGDLPPCWVKQRESGGNYSAVNWSGCGGYSCGGAWQFDPRTWAGYGGYYYAQDAPPSVQDERARQIWNGGRGCSHWAAC